MECVLLMDSIGKCTDDSYRKARAALAEGFKPFDFATEKRRLYKESEDYIPNHPRRVIAGVNNAGAGASASVAGTSNSNGSMSVVGNNAGAGASASVAGTSNSNGSMSIRRDDIRE